MKYILKILSGIGFMVMLLGGSLMNEPSLLAVILAFGGLGIFAGCSYIEDWLEWVERGCRE